MAGACAARYRARNPRATLLYRLFEGDFDEVKGQWEERFERRCGFWRGFVDEQVLRYLDCGLFRERVCAYPVSRLRRGVPSGLLLQDPRAVPVVLGEAGGGDGRVAGGGGLRGGGARAGGVRDAEELRPYFLHHRELLGRLAHAAWETVLELMCAAFGTMV